MIESCTQIRNKHSPRFLQSTYNSRIGICSEGTDERGNRIRTVDITACLLNASGGERMGKGNRSRNDDRSDSKNPNNPAYQASVDNRADQLNPDHNKAYDASRGEDDDEE